MYRSTPHRHPRPRSRSSGQLVRRPARGRGRVGGCCGPGLLVLGSSLQPPASGFRPPAAHTLLHRSVLSGAGGLGSSFLLLGPWLLASSFRPPAALAVLPRSVMYGRSLKRLRFFVHSPDHGSHRDGKAHVPHLVRSPAIILNCSSAASRSSTIAAASTPGSGRLALSSRLSSFSQKMSRLALSRATISP